LLTDSQRPVQLILAGKAHPADVAGQRLIAEWTRFIRHSRARQHAVFLADYDMLLTERLVQGVDLWLNTPLRPWEACGTSGMKALVNGALNLSVLDGWWAEAYVPEVGWAVGDGHERPADPRSDLLAAGALFDLLEREIVPRFYERDAQGIPKAWVGRMRRSMMQLTPQFSSARAVREYVEQHCLPCAARYRARAARGGAQSVADWIARMQRHWSVVRFEEVSVATDAGQHRFSILLALPGLDPDSVQVEMYADATSGHEPERHAASLVGGMFAGDGSYSYAVSMPASRPSGDYTARVQPRRDDVSLPLELNLILWQR
jgi:starch phosphorylase